MLQDDDAETEMHTNHVKCIVGCISQLTVNEGITALEAIGISVNKESVAYIERPLGNGKCRCLVG
jgi:hypothetical protein